MAQDITQQTLAQLKNSKNIVITIASGSNPDTVAGGLALKEFLIKQGKQAKLLSVTKISNKLNFLPASSTLSSALGLSKNLVVEVSLKDSELSELSYQKLDDKLSVYLTPKNGEFKMSDVTVKNSVYPFDLVITLGIRELSELGTFYSSHAEMFFGTPVINIDYKPGNESFGQINLVQLTSSSVSEIIFDLLQAYDTNYIDQNIATLLLTGLISQTNSFQSNKTTPQVFTKASSLVSLGAKQQEIVAELYRNKTLGFLRLWGRVLARIKQDDSNQFVYSMASAPDIERSQSTTEDLEDVLPEMVAQLGFAKTFAFLSEQSGSTQVSVYTNTGLNLAELFAMYKPEPSSQFAFKFVIPKSLTDAEAEVSSAISSEISKHQQ